MGERHSPVLPANRAWPPESYPVSKQPVSQSRAVKGPSREGRLADWGRGGVWEHGKMQVGRRSSTAMCLPHPNPGPPNNASGEISCLISCKKP